MEYRRETMVLRAPGGQRAGFLTWEQSDRQASLRCSLDALRPEEEVRLYWMPAGSFSLLDGGAFHADVAGAVRCAVRINTDAPPVAVALARGDGSLYAHAFARSATAEVSGAPERLQALLPDVRSKSAERVEETPSEPKMEPVPVPEPEGEGELDPLQARPQSPSTEALWPAMPWPPPPGLSGAVWRGGRWVLE